MLLLLTDIIIITKKPLLFIFNILFSFIFIFIFITTLVITL